MAEPTTTFIQRHRVALVLALLVAAGASARFVVTRRTTAALTATTVGAPRVVGDLAKANLDAKPDMCTGRDLKGTGARMDVFATADTTQPALQSGLVPMLDLNVTPKRPAAAGQTVRWSGWIKAHGTGTHRFSLPKGVTGQLSVARVPIIDASTGRADSTGTEMVADRFYPFTLIVTVDRTSMDAGTWLLAWTPPSGRSEPVMRGSLFPPTPDTLKTSVVASALPDTH